jgi:hypothetical protein
VPSFDIVNEIDIQEVDNAVNNTQREVTTRYDFRGSNSEVTFDRKEKNLSLVTADEMKLEALKEMLIGHIIKRGIDPKCLEFGDAEGNSKGQSRCKVIIQEGISREIAQKIVKLIKGTKVKVQPAIQDDQVRVTGKKIDDLQEIISFVKGEKIEIPLQFTNMKK